MSVLKPEYYCHECAIQNKIYVPSDITNISLTGTNYQLEKYIKHTAPIQNVGVISVFDKPEYQHYRGYTLSASASGCVEKDCHGRVNMIWCANEKIGITFKDGNFLTKSDSVKVVLQNNEIKVHSYPVDSWQYESHRCHICGKHVLS